MLELMWSKENMDQLFVGVQTYIVIMKNSIVVPQEDANRSTSRSYCITLGHILKGYYILRQIHLLNHVHFIDALFIILRNWKQPKCLSTQKLIK